MESDLASKDEFVMNLQLPNMQAFIVHQLKKLYIQSNPLLALYKCHP